MSATTTRALPAARHDDQALLDLVAAVAREAERRGEAQAAAPVSQRVFNRLRADVDRARTVDPAGPDRTPTANAIVIHFRARAIRPLTWADVVAAALARPRQREQWLVATRRSEQAHWLTDSHIAFALRRVAAELGDDTVSPRDYETVSQRLIKDDRATNGNNAVLAELLPTTDQVRHYCGDWVKALALAGLQPHEDPAARPKHKHQASSTQPPGMPVHAALAYYAAVNGAWASYPTLIAFARASAFALAARPRGPWTAVVHRAGVLLDGAGIQPPTGTGPKPLGRGKRLSFRYPVNGIPAAPPPGRSARPDDPEHRRLRHEFSVLSLRVFLSTRDRGDATSYHAYIAWRTPEDGWSAASRFVWSDVKPEALAANRRARREHGVDVPQAALDRGEELKAILAERRHTTELPPFPESVAAVLAGPIAETEAPKQ